MVHVLVRLAVKDQAVWKKVFEESGSLRQSFGSTGVHAFAKTGAPNEIFVLGMYKDVEKAREMFQSQEFKDATNKAGLVGSPEVTILDKLFDLPA